MAKFWLENDEVKSDIDLSVFNDDQMSVIHKGLEDGLNVSIYAGPSFHGNRCLKSIMVYCKIWMCQAMQNQNSIVVR